MSKSSCKVLFNIAALTVMTTGMVPTAAIAQVAMLTVDPVIIKTCNGPQKGKISWAVPAEIGARVVQIYAIDSGAKRQLVAEVGLQGSVETGAWIRGGVEIVLINKDTGKDIQRVGIRSVPC
jgi:hypothetical protein